MDISCVTSTVNYTISSSFVFKGELYLSCTHVNMKLLGDQFIDEFISVSVAPQCKAPKKTNF